MSELPAVPDDNDDDDVVPVGELPDELRFEFRVSRTPDEIVESFSGDAQVEWSVDGRPHPFPPPGSPQFQAWPRDSTTLFVRHTVPAAIPVVSPCVMIELVPGAQHTTVRGWFLHHPPRSRRRELTLKLAIVASAAYYLAIIALDTGLLFPHPYYLLILGAFTILGIMHNRPKARSMQAYGSALWGLIGQKFVPHALGEAEQEDPFRDDLVPR